MIHFIIRFGSLERDYSLSSFNLTGLVHESLFCYLLLLLYLSSMIHFFHSPFLLYHSTLLHDSDFQFHLPLCMYCLPIFYKSNLRMSIGYLQPLVLNKTYVDDMACSLSYLLSVVFPRHAFHIADL